MRLNTIYICSADPQPIRRPRLTRRLMSHSNIRNQRSPHLSNTTSPLLSALQNQSDLLGRSIPFSSFRAGSSPPSGAPNSLGSATGGVGLSGGPSPPPSAPASYSSGGGGFSASRQVRGYPGFEEQYHGTAGGNSNNNNYYIPTQRSAGVPLNGVSHLQAGESNYACELATIDELGLSGGNPRVAGGSGGGGDNVVCLGWDGGVDVWRIGRGAVEQVGRLEGLRGSVKGAKILPNPPLNDPLAAHRPLICLTVHSPILQGPGSDAEQGATVPLSESPYSSSPPSRPETSNSHRSSQNGDTATEWQTTVEVWSLATNTRLCKLLTSPSIPTADLGFGNFAPPPIWGNLRVQVAGDKIVVGVGSSGEVYVFGAEAGPSGAKWGPGGKEQEKAEWKCLDKLWTSVQFPQGQSASAEAAMGLGLGSLGFPSIGTPVFALSGRWLAYCPASTGTLTAGGHVGVPIVSHSVQAPAPPSQPPISAACSLEDEAFLNRMAREVTQEVIRGAKWAADAGFKKFQSYMHGGALGGNSPPLPHQMPVGMGMPQSDGMQVAQIGNPQQPSGLGQQLRQLQQMGGSPQQFQQQPAQAQYAYEPQLVSVVDLHKENGLPIATFLPPAGVSFLSFAPGGLSLLTASSKGDILFVWDLLKVVHHPPGSLNHHRSASASGMSDTSGGAHAPDALGKHVRQVARFTRMTVATIVDVDWSSPRGEKIAVITEKGTAHFYDLPYAALQWPPPRRPPPSSIAAHGQTTSAGAVVSNAVDLFNSSTRPLLTAARRRRSRSSSVGSPGGGGMFGSPSVGRRTSGAPGTSPNAPGGNKIPLPPSTSGIYPGCVKFLTAKERGFVAVIGGGLLRIYELRPGGSGKKGSTTGGVASGNWWEYDLPNVPATSEHTFTEPSDGKASGFWAFRSHWGRGTDEDNNTDGFWKTPLAWAEIETNSAFIPWHQERRVKMFVYDPPTYHKHLRPPGIRVIPPPPNCETDDTTTECRNKGENYEKTPPSPPPYLEPSELPPPCDALAEIPVTEPAPVVDPPQAPKEKWVFGMPMKAERIFLSDAGGRGDVTFSGDGEVGLEAAMMDGLQLDVASGVEEGFFEEWLVLE